MSDNIFEVLELLQRARAIFAHKNEILEFYEEKLHQFPKGSKEYNELEAKCIEIIQDQISSINQIKLKITN
ncbi:MAG: hypothetical protein EKK64_00740 [Neisseriaceae bacterium]|nr:MAG: hypothetical protein EKK64_00740 [Neisseriaceae bacterium]